MLGDQGLRDYRWAVAGKLSLATVIAALYGDGIARPFIPAQAGTQSIQAAGQSGEPDDSCRCNSFAGRRVASFLGPGFRRDERLGGRYRISI